MSPANPRIHWDDPNSRAVCLDIMRAVLKSDNLNAGLEGTAAALVILAGLIADREGIDRDELLTELLGDIVDRVDETPMRQGVGG